MLRQRIRWLRDLKLPANKARPGRFLCGNGVCMGPLFRVFLGIWAGYLPRPFEPAGAGLAKQHVTCPNAPHRLNAVDDLSVLFRLGRLGVALLPGQASLSTMCDICDDVMVDLLKGAEGLQTLPCSWACLKVPECVAMCENLKEFSQNRRAFASDLALIHSPTLTLTSNSSRFPCLAAGYCEDETKVDWDEQCHMVYPPAM